MGESSTHFIKRKHPLLYAILDMAFHRVTTSILVALSIGLGSCNYANHGNLAQKVQGLASVQTNIVNYIAP